MTTPTSTAMKRAAAVLAIVAGLLTGALWPAGPLDYIAANSQDAAYRIDPAIPTLTIVAKKLSTAEKHRLANDVQAPAMIGMLNANDRQRHAPAAPAF